jgi:hypothetical protein
LAHTTEPYSLSRRSTTKTVVALPLATKMIYLGSAPAALFAPKANAVGFEAIQVIVTLISGLFGLFTSKEASADMRAAKLLELQAHEELQRSIKIADAEARRADHFLQAQLLERKHIFETEARFREWRLQMASWELTNNKDVSVQAAFDKYANVLLDSSIDRMRTSVAMKNGMATFARPTGNFDFAVTPGEAITTGHDCIIRKSPAIAVPVTPAFHELSNPDAQQRYLERIKSNNSPRFNRSIQDNSLAFVPFATRPYSHDSRARSGGDSEMIALRSNEIGSNGKHAVIFELIPRG